MTNEDLINLADALMQAERDRKSVPPLTDTFPDMTDDEAYEIQLLNVRRRVDRGGRIRGHKIGLTAKSMQELFGVDEPDYGHLFDDMFEYEAMTVRTERYIAPRVEIETAFILGRTIEGSNVTVADVIRAVEWVVPSIEIIDSRIRDWRIKLADTIADNGSSAGVVLGGRPVRVSDLDLRNLSASLYIDDELVESGNTSAVLGNPITAVAWLAKALSRHGITLEEGHVVLPGTCVRAVPVHAGASVRGHFADLGDVSVHFS
jgi:2-keto-4-pentenoate hydratase